jgi:SPP1 family predicted phage head-tail adaptor
MPGFGVPKRTSIGSMRHRVSIQRQLITGSDDRGQPVYTWSDVVTNVPCKIRTLSGGEAEKARQLFSEATHRVEMRKPRAEIDEKMKLVFRGRDLFIGFIDDFDQVGRFTPILVAEQK